MEDITAYGEITGSHHKGETSQLAILLGVCFFLAGLFFFINGLYHVVVSSSPYWERVSIGPLAQEKGSGDFIAFLVLTLARPFFGVLLFLFALEIWDGKASVRRWIYLLTLPVFLYFAQALGDLQPDFSEELWSFDFLLRNYSTTAFMASMAFMSLVFFIIPFLSASFRPSSRDQSWIMTVVYIVILALGIAIPWSMLDPIEYDTAIFGNLPPFSAENSGFEFLILESVSLDYLDCMENIKALEKACEERSRVQSIKYENFATKLRTDRLVEILKSHNCLAREPLCPSGGDYMVEEDGTWHCSEHGFYDAERVARGRRRKALISGEDEALEDEGAGMSEREFDGGY